MAGYEYTSLAFEGFADKPVPNLFMRQERPASTLCVVYPGLNYTCDMPLLYYPANLLLQRGADVLQVKADYSHAAYQALPGNERLQWLYGDASAALRAGRAQRDYAQVVLVGKSIGTLALAQLIAHSAIGPANEVPGGVDSVASPAPGLRDEAIFVWLTPLLRERTVVEAAVACQNPAIFVVGTADRTYDAAVLARIREASRAEAVFVEGGDHRLEIDGDIYRSLRAMHVIVRGIEAFLERHPSRK